MIFITLFCRYLLVDSVVRFRYSWTKESVTDVTVLVDDSMDLLHPVIACNATHSLFTNKSIGFLSQMLQFWWMTV